MSHYIHVWKGKTEDIVLDCLEEACRNICDKVVNFHKIDRAHEKGVDIECVGEKKTHFQVKMKPGKKDLKQLGQLSMSDSDSKVYVCVYPPSIAFKTEMEEYESKGVRFWEAKDLHEFLISNRSQLYLRHLFLETDLIRNIGSTVNSILSCSEINRTNLQSSALNDWWLLKDRTVKLHASLEYLEDHWRQILLVKDRHDPDELRSILGDISRSLNIINMESGNDLKAIVREIREKMPSLLSAYLGRVSVGSDWIEVLKAVRMSDGKRKKIIENWVVPSQRFGSEYSLLIHYLRNLHVVSKALEDGVDWVFWDYLRDEGIPYTSRT